LDTVNTRSVRLGARSPTNAIGARASTGIGRIRLVPVAPEAGQSHCQAETTLQVLELIETPESGFDLVVLVDAVATNSNPRPDTAHVRSSQYSTTLRLPTSSWKSERIKPPGNVGLRHRENFEDHRQDRDQVPALLRRGSKGHWTERI